VGDFGFGWSLGLKNIRVEKSGVLGFKWFETASQEVFPNYCVEPTKAQTYRMVLVHRRFMVSVFDSLSRSA
jgi:hypothetical protein